MRDTSLDLAFGQDCFPFSRKGLQKIGAILTYDVHIEGGERLKILDRGVGVFPLARKYSKKVTSWHIKTYLHVRF